MTAATSGFTEDAAKPAFQAIEDARTARRCAARPRGELITITTGIAEGTVDE